MTVSASRGVSCAPRSTMLWTWFFHPTGPSRPAISTFKEWHCEQAVAARSRPSPCGNAPGAWAWSGAAFRNSAMNAVGSRRRCMSHLPRAQVRDRIRWMPGGDCAQAVAVGVDVEEIGAAVGDRALGARDGAVELARLLDDLGLDAERLRRFGIVDVRAAEITGHVAAGPELSAAVMPDPVALIVI